MEGGSGRDRNDDMVGLAVHARSTHAAAIDRESGELTRARFGAGVEEVTAWLQGLPQPIHGCYEAGPTSEFRS